MKEEIYKICTKLNDGQIAVVEATEQLLLLFSVSGRSEQFVCGTNRVMGEKRCERQWGQCEELYPQTNCH